MPWYAVLHCIIVKYTMAYDNCIVLYYSMPLYFVWHLVIASHTIYEL